MKHDRIGLLILLALIVCVILIHHDRMCKALVDAQTKVTNVVLRSEQKVDALHTKQAAAVEMQVVQKHYGFKSA